jgi:hypothetical protein
MLKFHKLSYLCLDGNHEVIASKRYRRRERPEIADNSDLPAGCDKWEGLKGSCTELKLVAKETALAVRTFLAT